MTNGRIIGVPNTATVGSAPGVWDLEDVQIYRLTNSWPRADAIAEGGVITTAVIGGITYQIHTFTGSGVFDLYRPYPLQYLIVAGGGGGGIASAFPTYGSGGGGGGMLTNVAIPGYPQYTTVSLNAVAGAYPVAVGAGGGFNTSGSDSVFNYVPAPITAVGGGFGGGGPNVGGGVGGPGGSGGGGAVVYPSGRSGGTGIPGQGFPGGTSGGTQGLTAGGGGAGGAGSPGPSATPRAGAGVPTDFDGTGAVLYSRGGGQRGDATWPAGGAGEGGIPNPAGPTPGADGIVIIRYAI